METLDKHFRDLAKAAFARYGFAQGDVLARWPEIVGAELASVSEPERIRWGRGASGAAAGTGATLVVRAAPGRGLELQHAIPVIIERINRFYGYGAVTAVKIVQGRFRGEAPQRPAATALPPDTLAAVEARLEAVGDEALRSALLRLGTQVLGQARGSPQGK